MMILSATLLTFNRSNYGQIALFQARDVFTSAVNQAKTLAVEKFSQNVDACAFGVYIKGTDNPPREFVLFQTLKLDPAQDCVLSDGSYNFATDFNAPGANVLAIQNFSLDSRLRFSNPPSGGESITFVPPDLTTLSTVPLPATTVIETLDGTLSTSISVEAGGQIVSH